MKISKISTTYIVNQQKTARSFKGAPLTGLAKAADIFIKSQENLSSTRFIQDTATNWAPKAAFSRSKADFAEMSFLEFTESAVFYFASPLLGEKLFRNNVFKKLQPKNIAEKINEQIPETVEKITKNKAITDEIKKRTIGTKAGIVLACTAIPVAEYTLSFAKNLFTLKAFKKSDFNNIADLNKKGEKKEDINRQKRVEEHAYSQFKKAAVISAAGIATGAFVALNSHKSDKVLKFAKTVLEPGKAAASGLKKIGVKEGKLTDTVRKFRLDFANEKGKLALSKGQLALTAITGLFGYSKAAEDRGKLDVAEVWTRVPLVVLYTIFGSELFEKGFTKILQKKNKFSDVIKKGADGKIITPLRKELPDLAKKISKERKTDAAKELVRLTKEKAVIQAVPYAFSLLFTGFALSAITRLTTQLRYNKQHTDKVFDKTVFSDTIGQNDTPEIFKNFNNRS